MKHRLLSSQTGSGQLTMMAVVMAGALATTAALNQYKRNLKAQSASGEIANSQDRHRTAIALVQRLVNTQVVKMDGTSDMTISAGITETPEALWKQMPKLGTDVTDKIIGRFTVYVCEQLSAAATITTLDKTKCATDGSQVAIPVNIAVSAAVTGSSLDTTLAQSSIIASSEFTSKNKVTVVTTKALIQFDSGTYKDVKNNVDVKNQNLAQANLWDPNICVFMKPARGVTFENNKTKFKLEDLVPKTSDELEDGANRLGIKYKELPYEKAYRGRVIPDVVPAIRNETIALASSETRLRGLAIVETGIPLGKSVKYQGILPDGKDKLGVPDGSPTFQYFVHAGYDGLNDGTVPGSKPLGANNGPEGTVGATKFLEGLKGNETITREGKRGDGRAFQDSSGEWQYESHKNYTSESGTFGVKTVRNANGDVEVMGILDIYKQECAGLMRVHHIEGDFDLCTRVVNPKAQYTSKLTQKCVLKNTSSLPVGKKFKVDARAQVTCGLGWPSKVKALIEDHEKAHPLEIRGQANEDQNRYLHYDDLQEYNIHRFKDMFNGDYSPEYIAMVTAKEGSPESTAAIEAYNFSAKGRPDVWARQSADKFLESNDIPAVKREEIWVKVSKSNTASEKPGEKHVKEDESKEYWELETLLSKPVVLTVRTVSECNYFAFEKLDDPKNCKMVTTDFTTTGYWGALCRTNDGCFAADTLITMADGTTKQIKDIKTGDVVFNPKTGRSNVVKYTTVGPEKKPMYKIGSGLNFVKVTEEHPFLTTSRGWQTAMNLKVGDILELGNGAFQTIDTVEPFKDETDPAVYNVYLDAPEFLLDEHFVLANGIITGDLMIQQNLKKGAIR